MKVLILSPHSQLTISAFANSGVLYTTNKEDSYTHIYCQVDQSMVGLENAPDLRLIDKAQLSSLAQEAGLPVLPQITLTSKEQLLSFNDGPVILKPSLNTGGVAGIQASSGSFGQINNTIFYKIFNSPQRLAEMLELISPNIWDDIASQKYIVQKAIQNTDGTSLVLTVLGCVNGSGNVKLLPIMPATRRSFAIGNELVEGFFEPNTVDVWGITSQVESLVENFAIKNNFIKLQFLWDGETAFLHDFSYTASTWMFTLYNDIRHFVDQIKYVYDAQPDLTIPIDFTFGLKHVDSDKVASLPNGVKVVQLIENKALIGCKGSNREDVAQKLNV